MRRGSWAGGRYEQLEPAPGSYERSVADARAFLRELGTPELGPVLTAFGLEHNPELLRLFTRAGRALHAARHLR